jgi:hypothetical protein
MSVRLARQRRLTCNKSNGWLTKVKEGSTMPTIDETGDADNDDEVCRSAKELSQSDLRKELDARGINATGFWSDDVKRLQVEFDR